MNKKEQFIRLLKEYGVTKCHVSSDFNPMAKYSGGMIFVNVNSDELIRKIFRMYTRKDDLDTPEGEELGILYSDFRLKKSNINL